jgi:hypothetical protein
MAVTEHAIVSNAHETIAAAATGTQEHDVSDMLDLWAHKWTPILNRVSWGADSGGLSIEWVSEHLGYHYVESSGTFASGGTTFVVVSGGTGLVASTTLVKQVQAGTLLYAYGAASSTTSADCFLVVASVGDASARVVTVEQLSSDLTHGGTLAAGTKFYILGHYANEGSDPFPDSTRPRSMLSNNFSILRKDVKITGSMAATDMYAVDNEPRHQIAMRLLEMQLDRERALLLSKSRARSTTVASYMKGCYDFLDDYESSDWVDASTTTLTESALNDLVSNIWDQGGSPSIFFGHKDQIRKFTQWDQARVRTTPDAKMSGHHVTKYLTDIGEEIELIPMRKWPTNVAMVLSLDKIKLHAKKGRKLIMEKLAKVGDYDRWQMLSEFSMKMEGYDKGYHGMFNKLS